MKRIIKRYQNRKLYDVKRRRYITLKGIAGLIREGIDVKVIDKRTGEDITKQVLAQIIAEESREGSTVFSTDHLSEIIRWGSRAVNDCFDTARHAVSGIFPLFSSKEKKDRDEVEELKKRMDALEKNVETIHKKAR